MRSTSESSSSDINKRDLRWAINLFLKHLDTLSKVVTQSWSSHGQELQDMSTINCFSRVVEGIDTIDDIRQGDTFRVEIVE